MGRDIVAKCRLCRREGAKLFLKGEKCHTSKCVFEKRKQPPGQQPGFRKRKMSQYAQQLREKQKVKRYYGLREKQFYNLFEAASKLKGITGENLLQLLERRLDNIVYRCGFASSRQQARQIVRHGFILVNGAKVNIPSYICKVEDEITLKNKELKISEKSIEISKQRGIKEWISLDGENKKAKILKLPEKKDIEIEITESLIVELYSK